MKTEDFAGMNRPFLIEGRRIYDAEKFRAAGVKFAAIGLDSLEVG